jgi:hypothetical protein
MASTPVKKSEKTSKVELHPDAWQRFKRAAGVVAKSPPQHRVAKKKKTPKKREASKPASRPRSRQKINEDRNNPKAGG